MNILKSTILFTVISLTFAACGLENQKNKKAEFPVLGRKQYVEKNS